MSKLQSHPCSLPGLRLLEPARLADNRGYFSEIYSRQELAKIGFECEFVQDNESLSKFVGTLRGLHYQTAPFAQDKLVRVVRGRIWDVAVDLRRSSPTFGNWQGFDLSSENGLQLLVPVGFAHGFLTLEPDTIVAYKVTAPYSAANDAGIAWDDADLAIDWPLSDLSPHLSDKDLRQPRLSDALLFD